MIKKYKQNDRVNYTTQNIVLRVLRVLTDIDIPNYPSHFIGTKGNEILLKWYIGQLFLFARDILDGEDDIYASCSDYQMDSRRA